MSSSSHGTWQYLAGAGSVLLFLGAFIPFLQVVDGGVVRATLSLGDFLPALASVVVAAAVVTALCAYFQRPGALWLIGSLSFGLLLIFLIPSRHVEPSGWSLVPLAGSALILVAAARGESVAETPASSGGQGPPRTEAWLVRVPPAERSQTTTPSGLSGHLKLDDSQLSFVSSSGIAFSTPAAEVTEVRCRPASSMPGSRGDLLELKVQGRPYAIAFMPSVLMDEGLDIVERPGLLFAHHALMHTVGVIIGAWIGRPIEKQAEAAGSRRKARRDVRQTTRLAVEAWRLALVR